MEQDVELLTELVQTLTNDVTDLKKMVADQPKPIAPPDMRPTLEKVANAINGIRGRVESLSQQKAPAPVVDLSRVEEQLRQLQQQVRQSPANRISKAVQYGTGLLAVSLLLTGVLGYWAMKWKDERDQFEVSDWKWRAVRQDGEDYALKLDHAFARDSTAEYYKTQIVKMEQADATREAAKRAAEQAKVMNAQADQLEGK